MYYFIIQLISKASLLYGCLSFEIFFFFASKTQKISLSSLWLVRGLYGNICFSLIFGLSKMKATVSQFGVSS